MADEETFALPYWVTESQHGNHGLSEDEIVERICAQRDKLDREWRIAIKIDYCRTRDSQKHKAELARVLEEYPEWRECLE